MSVEPWTGGMLNPRTDSWTAVVEQVAKFAVQIQETELVPVALRKKPAAIAAVILYGREVGLAPMTALRSSYVVNGRVALAAETLRALVLAAGHDIAYEEATTARCVAAGKRRGTDTWHTVEWTLDLARKAGIAGGQSWQRYPRQMLKARATAELCRDLFPDVIGGFEAIEELDATPNETLAPAPDTTPRRTVRRQPAPAGGEPQRSRAQDAPVVPAAQAPQPDPPAGPPLPGEPGYEDLKTPARQPNPPEAAGPAEEPETRETGEWAITAPQLKKLHATLSDLNIHDRNLGLAILTRITNRQIDSSKNLTRRESALAIDTLTRISQSEDMTGALAAIQLAANPAAELAALFGETPDDKPRRTTDDVDTGELT